MKIRRIAALAAAGFMATALVACSTSAPEPGPTSTGDGAPAYENVTIKINTGVPPTHHLNQNVFLPWKDMVEEATDGAVTVDLYDADTLGSLSTVLADMAAGLYDVGIIVPTFFLDSPTYALTVANLVAAAPDQATANQVISEFFAEHSDLITVPGVEVLGASVTTMYEVWSQSPMTSIDDLRGKQIRVGSALEADAVSMLGAVPVQLSPSETYQGLERGTVNAAYWPPESALGFKVPEVAPHLFETGMATTGIAIGIRENLMDGFSDPLRDLFETELLPELPVLLAASYGKVGEANEAGIQALVDAGDLTRVKISEEESRQVAAASEPLWQDWIAEANSRGLDGDQLVADWLRILESTGAERPF